MAWLPGDPWPSSTPGGAAHAAWGGYVRFWLLAEIAAGYRFKIGQAANDRLNAGNVLTAPAGLRALPTTSGLWVDLTCDLVDCEWSAGAGTGAGILSKAEAGTLTATLYDPTGKYDPANPDTPFALSGRSRLMPGIRVLAVVEVVNDPFATPPAVTQWTVFTGTADRWSEQWAKEPSDRRAKLTATDFTKQLVKLDRDEQAPQGAGEPVSARMNRIATYFGFPVPYRPSIGGEGIRTLAATTLAQSAWELLNRTVDDELGYLWVRGDGVIHYTAREHWRSWQVAPLNLGCGDPGTFYDIVTDATPAAFDATQINTVSAARTGGAAQHAANTASVNRWGERSYQRTDLGLNDDPQAAQWATDLVNVAAYPRNTVDRVTLVPAVGRSPYACWYDVLNYLTQPWAGFVLGLFRVVYRSGLFDYTVDTTVRMVGYQFHVDTDRFEIEMRTVDANIASGSRTFHAGAHAYDRLDAGNVAA